MSEDVSNKVKKIVADHLGIDESKVTEESSFIDDLGADSLDTVELVMAFEEEFGSEISDSDAEKILTVGDAVNLLRIKQIKNKVRCPALKRWNVYTFFTFWCWKNYACKKISKTKTFLSPYHIQLGYLGQMK